MSEAEVEALFAEAQMSHLVAEFEAAIRAADKPFARPSDPPWMLLRASEWETFDQAQRLYREMESKYGKAMPGMFARARAMTNGRGIW